MENLSRRFVPQLTPFIPLVAFDPVHGLSAANTSASRLNDARGHAGASKTHGRDDPRSVTRHDLLRSLWRQVGDGDTIDFRAWISDVWDQPGGSFFAQDAT